MFFSGYSYSRTLAFLGIWHLTKKF